MLNPMRFKCGIQVFVWPVRSGVVALHHFYSRAADIFSKRPMDRRGGRLYRYELERFFLSIGF